jgi:hypothetical protein
MEGHQPGQEMTMHLQLDGDAFYALDLNRLVDISMHGPITAEGAASGVPIKGKGSIELRVSADWIKVAGKSVK